MGTLFDYLDWRGDLSFSECAVTEADNLIFSHISYLDLYKIVPASYSAKGCVYLGAMKRYKQLHKGENNNIGFIIPPELVTLATRAARSERFARLRLVGHVNLIDDGEQMQFSATTFLLDDGSMFVAFRGTDDTIVGWKESLNMSFMSPVPAQSQAVKYLCGIADAHPDRRIYVGGHSKGGNLAVFAAVKCREDIKERIVAVYSNDGPGFDRDFIESDEYADMRDRIHTLVPESSVIGMLLEHEENYEVVKSTQVGLYQHNGLSWEVMGGRFVHTDSVTKESKKVDKTLKEWLGEMSHEQRQDMIDTLYEILSSTNAKTLTELNSEKLKLVKAWNTVDAEDKRFIKRLIRLLVRDIKPKKEKDKEVEEKTQGQSHGNEEGGNVQSAVADIPSLDIDGRYIE